jgi:rod shape-determining protein MreC
MAPPSNRRPGYSRKAQYGLFFGYVAAVTGCLMAVLLLVVAVIDPRGFGALRGTVSDLTAPISSGGRGLTRGVRAIGDEIAAYIDAGSKNRALTAEVEASRAKLVEARAIAFENARLKRLLKLVEARPDAIVTARLVSSTPTISRRFAILNAGFSDGVRVGQPVRAPDGLVGRVESVGRFSARVALLTDGGNIVPGRRARDGLPVISTGSGDGMLDIRALSTGPNPLKVGDVVMTSGIGGIYAPNIPVAIVVRVTPDAAIGRPLAHPSRLDFAVVEPTFQPEAQAAPAPPPAPDTP